MKVRILSGNQTGAVVDLPQSEAEAAIATGFAEVVVDVPVVSPPFVPEVEPELEP